MRTKLRAQRAGKFILSVTCHAIGPRALRTGGLIAFLDQWLASFRQEPGTGAEAAEFPGPRGSRIRWPGIPSANGWSFEFEAVPLPNSMEAPYLRERSDMELDGERVS